MSNSSEVLQRIGEQNTHLVKSFVMDKGSDMERVLGMVWLPQEDVFTFSLKFREDLKFVIDGTTVPTKRQLVSIVMSVFDPLGLVAPFVVHGKTIVQDVWRTSIDWDEPIPAIILPKWEQWIKLLIRLESVKIPRCYFPGYSTEAYKSLELHVFVDASNTAYAAVAYFRVVDNGSIRCSLVSAKTKVAPLKLLSVPRLELQAAVIGSRLMKTIRCNHSLAINRVVMWSDSVTVLCWLRSDPRKYRQYVAFRVTEILENTNISEWRYVSSKQNVADEATKWGSGPCFTEHSRWFKAPEFLYKSEDKWPRCIVEQTITEEMIVHTHKRISTEPVIEFKRFSKWERLIRSVAYVYRFYNNCKARCERNLKSQYGNLSSKELQVAEASIYMFGIL